MNIEEKIKELEDAKDKSDETVWCPNCGRPYGFVNCRVTYHTKSGDQSRCLACPDPR